MSAGEGAAWAEQEPGAVSRPPVVAAAVGRHPHSGVASQGSDPGVIPPPVPFPVTRSQPWGPSQRGQEPRMATGRVVPSPPSYSPGRRSSRRFCEG